MISKSPTRGAVVLVLALGLVTTSAYAAQIDPAEEPKKASEVRSDVPVDPAAVADAEQKVPSPGSAGAIIDGWDQLLPQEPAPMTCLCATFNISCQNICGSGNYNFECYRHSYVSCDCIEGEGGFYHSCT